MFSARKKKRRVNSAEGQMQGRMFKKKRMILYNMLSPTSKIFFFICVTFYLHFLHVFVQVSGLSYLSIENELTL